MSAEVESAVAGAFAAANESASESTPETDISPDISTEETTETPVVEEVTPDPEADKEAAVVEETPAAEGTPKPAEKPAEGAKPAEKDQLTKDLEELGIKAPKEGERENRLPHSRVKTLMEKFGKKIEGRFTGEVETLKTENTRLTTRQRNFDKADELAATDPDRYLKLLSAIHPGKYDKFLAGGSAAAPAKEAAKPSSAAANLGAEPAPDVKFEDGSLGYSPEQHKKLLQWNRDTAKAEAKAEAIEEIETRMEAKYGKIAKAHESQEALAAEIPKVKEAVNRVYQVWGKELVDKHENEIVAFMEKHPELTTSEAAAHILVPKVRADRNTMRADLIRETKNRTAAAAKTVPGAAAANKEGTEPETLQDVVRAAVATLRR